MSPMKEIGLQLQSSGTPVVTIGNPSPANTVKLRKGSPHPLTAPQPMTGSAPHLAAGTRNHRTGLVLIAAYKLLGALLFIAIGVGALRLLHKDIDDVVWRMIGDLKMNPESRLVNFIFEKAELLNDPILRRIGLGAFCYAAVGILEAIGLYLEKAWGELLTLIITASFLPWEIFEVVRHVTWLRVALLVINTLVFIYLLKMVALRRKPAEERHAAAADPERS